jgi:N-acetylmuramoyl-L-alanine amidase
MIKKIVGLVTLASVMVTAPASAQQALHLTYPSTEHTTSADRIFFIGTAPPTGDVTINGQVIERSSAGHFAPSLPLQMGENQFSLRYDNQEIQVKITRTSSTPVIPSGLAFAEGSLMPSGDISKMPGELVCFSAIASPKATVSVKLSNQTIPLSNQVPGVELPPNSAVLVGQNQPAGTSGKFQGCIVAPASVGELGTPVFQLSLDGQTTSQPASGKITILSPATFEIAEVTADAGVTRTGPGTNYSRLTPLPKGTQARIIGREAEWLQLEYGAWIKAEETRIFNSPVPPQTLIRSVSSRMEGEWQDIYFPLQMPVPVSVNQGTNTLTLTLYNTIAQTDTIRFDDNPLIERLDWQQATPNQVQYIFNFKAGQQWGYKLRYEGTTLVLSFRRPPAVRGGNLPLSGVKITLDPGHGSSEDLGARGPTGYPEKDVTLIVSKLLRDELVKRGATVYMTREGDDDLWPQDRVKIIEQQEPDLALSVHYNALPDSGDALKTQGVGMFWYHPQAHSLAVFLHNYLVEKLGRPSYGVYWNNLALTRPAVAPSILLELGFMINPVEFEWIVDPQAQKQLATTLADGIVEWMQLATR